MTSSTYQPVGNDFVVNTTLADKQEHPGVAGLSDGRYVVAWPSWETGHPVVRARIYDSNNIPIGDDFIVGDLTTSDAGFREIAVTGLTDGRFVITWEAADGHPIHARMFDHTGAPLSEHLIAVSSMEGHDSSISALPGGGFVVAWQYREEWSVRARVFNSAGAPISDELVVSPGEVGFRGMDPAVSALSSGGFVVTWEDSLEIHGRIYDGSGVAASSDFIVKSTTDAWNTWSTVTSLPSGGFVVAWSTTRTVKTENGIGTILGSTDIYARIYDISGTAIGDDFLVNTFTNGDQVVPWIATLPGGQFVVAWHSVLPTGEMDIRGRVYDSSGTPVGDDLLINSTLEGIQAWPVVAGLTDGRFVVAFESSGVGEGDIIARVFEQSSNHAPIITSNGGGDTATITVAENTSYENKSFRPPVTTVVADDGGTGQQRWFSLAGGEDQNSFSIDAITGALYFKGPPDFEKPNDTNNDNVYEVIVRVSDSDGGLDTQALSVRVSDIGSDKGQTLFLEFGRAAAPLPGLLSPLPFTYDKPDAGVSSEDQKEIAQIVQAIFGDFAIDVTTSEPKSGEYSTIYIGGSIDLLPQSAPIQVGVLGIAQHIDFGRQDKSDSAVVFSGDPYFQQAPSFFTIAVSEVIAHEAGHIMGLLHVEPPTELMFPLESILAIKISNSNLPLGQVVPGTDVVLPIPGFTQNSWQTLAQNVGLADGSPFTADPGAIGAPFEPSKLAFRFSTAAAGTIYGAKVAIALSEDAFPNLIPVGDITPGLTVDFLRPNIAAMATFFLIGSSTQSGPIDIFGTAAPLAGAEIPNLGTLLTPLTELANFNLYQKSESSFTVIGNGVVALDGDPVIPTPPVHGHDDAYVVAQNHDLTAGTGSSVLVNDDNALRAILAVGPTHGSLELSSDGSFNYTPAAGFFGIDSFTYHASNGGSTADAQALLYVVPTLGVANPTLSLLALSAEEQIAATYTAFFGRGADAAGFQFWVGEFNAGLPTKGASALFAAIANSFGVSGEAQALYPFLANPKGASDSQISGFLDTVYNNLFNRSSDAGGLAYWTGQIKQTMAEGKFVGTVLVDIISGTQVGPDVQTLMGKVAVGLEFVHQQQAHGMQWNGIADNLAATALLHAVTSDLQTVLVGISQADLLIAEHG